MNAIPSLLESAQTPEEAREIERGRAFADAMDRMFAPTPAMRWLEQLALQRQQREETHKALQGQTVVREAVGDRNRKIARILARDGEGCCYCGKPLGDDMTLEHRIAQANGGSDDLENLTLAHAACNRRVGDLPPDMKDELAARILRNSNPGGGASNKCAPHNQ
jgi:hypothetical protein